MQGNHLESKFLIDFASGQQTYNRDQSSFPEFPGSEARLIPEQTSRTIYPDRVFSCPAII